MIVGFNHNVSYKGTDFHVQTEDSGIKSPQLVTLLYYGGTIISSQKTVYADILKVDNLNQVVEDLAKEQHKGMLRRLTKGEFDQRMVDLGIPLSGAAVAMNQEAPAPDIEPARTPTEVVEPIPPVAPLPEAAPFKEPVAEPVKIVEEPIVDKFRKSEKKPETDLDELIFAYLSAGSS